MRGLKNVVHIYNKTSFIHKKEASLVAQMAKNLPVMRETQVRSLGWEDSLEKDMATHSNILAWTIPWMEEPGGLQSVGRKDSDTTERLHFSHWSVILNDIS